MESISPNIELLRQLYRQSPVARAFFDHAARRERDQSETKVDRILILLRADGHAFPRREIITLFRKLQEQGYGQFVEGRRGWPSRFVWSSGLISVGRAAAGDSLIGIRHGIVALEHYPQFPFAVEMAALREEKLDRIVRVGW